MCHGDRYDAKYQVAHHFGAAAHAHCVSAVIVLEVGVDPFGAAALVVADMFSQPMANQRFTLFLHRRFLFEGGVAARIDVDDRHMVEAAAVLAAIAASHSGYAGWW